MECAGAEPKSVPSPTSVSPHHSDLSQFITCIFSVRSLSEMPTFLYGLNKLSVYRGGGLKKWVCFAFENSRQWSPPLLTASLHGFFVPTLPHAKLYLYTCLVS